MDTEYQYSAEFASGYQAHLTVSPTEFRIVWTPDLPRLLKGQARRRFLSAYRAWRNECVSDFSRRTGISVEVREV